MDRRKDRSVLSNARGKREVMNIKNYTSGVPVERTIANIESRLAEIGATGIMKFYGADRKVSAIVFNMPEGARQHAVRVPANVHACFEAMWKQHCREHSRPREDTKARVAEQAMRTAWRLMQDWIEVQVSMILMRQADPLEVFLPYVWDGKQTYFEYLKSGQFKALPEHV